MLPLAPPHAREPYLRALLIAALLSLPALTRAHEVLHEVRPGGAVAVKFFESDGELLARAPYQLWAPGDAEVPWQEGRTDRAGWLSFVPEAPGRWRIRVVGDDGHGLTVEVDTAALAAPSPAPAPVAVATPARPLGEAPPAVPGASTPGAAFVLRPLLGVLLIGALFGGLVLLYRRRR